MDRENGFGKLFSGPLGCICTCALTDKIHFLFFSFFNSALKLVNFFFFLLYLREVLRYLFFEAILLILKLPTFTFFLVPSG